MEGPMNKHDEAAALARSIFHLRRERVRHLPVAVLSEAAWNLMLAFFIADADGRRITGRQALVDADLSPTVGKRWIVVLHQEGLAIGDGKGDLDDVIGLTPAGLSAVEACMRDAQDHFRSIVDQARA
jgi:hypothetical protein